MAWNGEIRRRIQEIKDRVRIEEVARALGIEMTAVGRLYRTRCLVPSHEDKEPSFTIDPAKQRFRCYGCGVRGDVVDLVKLARGVEIGEALAYLDGGTARSNGNGGGVEHPGRVSTQEMLEEPEALESLARLTLHHREVFATRPEGLEYLAGRGLADRALLERLGVGYCDGTGRNLFPVETRRRLSALGLFNEKGNECFYKCVTFPLTDCEGRVVGLYGRGIDPKQKRHLYLAGPHRGVFNRTPEKGTRLVLAESVLDAVAWLSMGASNATGLFGVHGLTAEIEAYLVEVEPSEVVLALDRDREGEKATEGLAARLLELGIGRLSRVTYPEGVKDAMDLVAAGRGDEGRRILGAATVVGGGLAAAPVGDPEVRAVEEPYLRFSEGELVYRRGDLEYRITDLGPKGSGSRVSQTVVVKRGGLVVHTDQIRVFKESERQRIIGRASAALSIQPARVGEDLKRIVGYLATFWENGAEACGSKKDMGDPPPSEEARREAMSLLCDPALLDRIAADIETVGYVGDRDAKILVYLVALSRRLERPLSGIIKSSTGAGKSALMDAVVSLVPPKEVYSLSRLTPGALWWFGREDLVHKLLVVDEAAGLAEALYALRTFQERRKISQAVPVKDPMTGALGTKVSEVLGPAAVIFATTLARLDREDENRALTITLSEDKKHTQMIHAFQKSQYTQQGYERNDRAERVKRLHHDAQRLLAPVRVLIPFQDRLVFPDMRPETTRDARRVLGVLEVVTYLFQYQREREKGADGYIYVHATIADYRAAYELVARLVWASLDDLAPQERRLYHIIKDWVEREASAAGVKPGDYHFTRRSLRENTGYSQDALKRYLRRLVEMELILIVHRKSSGSHVYRLAPLESAQKIGHLTTPDELEGKA